MPHKSVSDLASEWRSVGLRGLLAIVAGVVVLVTPISPLDRFLHVFGVYLVLDGALELYAAVQAARSHESWLKRVVNGLLGVLFGLVNVIGGGLPALTRAYFVALRTFVTGVFGMIDARRLRTGLPTSLPAWLLMLAGIGSVIFSFVIVIGPTLQKPFLSQLDWLAALYLIGFGFLLLTIAARLRALTQKPTPTATG